MLLGNASSYDEIELSCASQFGKSPDDIFTELYEQFLEHILTTSDLLLERYSIDYQQLRTTDSFEPIDDTQITMSFFGNTLAIFGNSHDNESSECVKISALLNDQTIFKFPHRVYFTVESNFADNINLVPVGNGMVVPKTINPFSTIKVQLILRIRFLNKKLKKLVSQKIKISHL